MMNPLNRQRWRVSAWGILLLTVALAGCTGRGEVILLDLQAAPGAVHATASEAAPLKIAVVPFEAERTIRLWSRTHLWGGKTYYSMTGGRPITVMGRMVADYFNQRGWQAWVAAPGKDGTMPGADVTITGTVQEFSAYAISHFGRTWLNAEIKVAIQATNAKDGSTVRMTLSHDISRRDFWFEPEDVQAIVREALTETLSKFVLSTRVDERSLRMR